MVYTVYFWLHCSSKYCGWALPPLWHFPDEESHFAQIQNTVEFGLNYPKVTSKEIAISDKLLGLNHNQKNINTFVTNPEHKIQYSRTLKGLYEDEIKNLPKGFSPSNQLKLITDYPFLYYGLSGLGYFPLKSANLITRVFAMRFVSVLIFLATVWLSYKIGEIVFGKKSSWALCLALLVSFQPMVSYMGAAVNSDNLLVLLFTLLIYGCLLVLNLNRVKGWVFIAGSLILGMVTKQQMAIGFLVALPLALHATTKSKRKHWEKRKVILYSLVSFLILVSVGYLGNIGRLFTFVGISGVERLLSNLFSPDLPVYVSATLIKTYREILPWYWGTFRWMHVTLPRWTNRLLMGLVAASLTGVGMQIFDVVIRFRKKQGLTYSQQSALFFLFASVIYYLSLVFWDYSHYREHGVSFGLQGRYFFPVIAAHMGLILIGVRQLIRFFKKDENFLLGALGGWWVILQLVGLHTLAATYYDLSSASSLIIQASQYKPAIFKGWWWFIWVGLFMASTSIFTFKFLRHLWFNRGKQLKLDIGFER